MITRQTLLQIGRFLRSYSPRQRAHPTFSSYAFLTELRPVCSITILARGTRSC